MFGKPEWFKPKTAKWGLRPVTWQGWLYTGGWIAALALPFLLLVERHQPLEAAGWLAFSGAALLYDVSKIRKVFSKPRASQPTMAQGSRDVLYIG